MGNKTLRTKNRHKAMFDIPFLLLFACWWLSARAECCLRTNIRGRGSFCEDGKRLTFAYEFCGVGNCNVFGCKCKDGCRKQESFRQCYDECISAFPKFEKGKYFCLHLCEPGDKSPRGEVWEDTTWQPRLIPDLRILGSLMSAAEDSASSKGSYAPTSFFIHD